MTGEISQSLPFVEKAWPPTAVQKVLLFTRSQTG